METTKRRVNNIGNRNIYILINTRHTKHMGENTLCEGFLFNFVHENEVCKCVLQKETGKKYCKIHLQSTVTEDQIHLQGYNDIKQLKETDLDIFNNVDTELDLIKRRRKWKT